jgi:hypothetical protein
MYICRWQNGDFSAVYARSREHAITLLDEVDNAELGELFTAKDFMVHFRLRKEAADFDEVVPVELEAFGEATEDVVCERVYPIFWKAAMDADEQLGDEAVTDEKWDVAMKQVNDALTTERTRSWGAKEPEISNDPLAARLQEAGYRIPKAVAEAAVREHRRKKIVQMPPKTNRSQ